MAINVGVCGYGYWGPNLVRNFIEAPGSTVVAVCDPRMERLAQVRNRCPSARVSTDYADLLSDTHIDAIAVATPVSTHFDLAMRALQAGKHVWVEKPLTDNSKDGEILVEEAARRGRVLLVDHTFAYTGAVRKIKDCIASGELGDTYYYDSVRVNLGLFQHDVNVLWDLAVHDLSILDFIFPAQQPTTVSATGMSHVPGSPQDMAYLTLFYGERMLAHIHVNWLSPLKIRRTLVGGSKKMIVYDDLEPSEKIKIYDKGISVNDNVEGIYQLLIGYRSGDMWAPHLDSTEALRAGAQHFIDCIEHGKQPVTDGKAGLRVVKILEAASASMAKLGQPMEVV